MKNEKIKSKLNDETKKSKRRLTLEKQYKQSGMTEEEAAAATAGDETVVSTEA